MDIKARQKRDLKRFFSKINKTSSCWIWTAGKNSKMPYGRFWHNGKSKNAHRFSYILHKGKIPDGLQLDHLCRNPSCVNPDHLEAVTHKVNMERSHRATSEFCQNGHRYSAENIFFNKYGKTRRCLTCHIKWKENYLRNLREINSLKVVNYKTHCLRGHELPSFEKGVNRPCRVCAKDYSKELSKLVGQTRSKDHCINGHEYTAENTRINSKGYRMCRTCHKLTANLPKRKDRSQCKHGHKFTEENTYLNSRGVKECFICKRHRDHLRCEKIKKLRAEKN